MQRHELLARVPLFQGLSDEARQSLALRLVEQRLRAGQQVFAKGDAGATMFLLMAGKVEIFLPAERGVDRVTLKQALPGDHFGELALFDDKPRSASAEAVSDTVLLELSREHFIGDIVRSETAVLAILSELAARLRDTNALLSQRAARDVVKEYEEKLSWAQRLADRVAELNGSWAFICGLVALTFGWATMNSFPQHGFDPYPYPFFNLFLGILVGLQGPLIMMSQNRQAAKDRAQASTDFRVNLKNEVGIENLGRDVAALRLEVQEKLAALERAQAGPAGHLEAQAPATTKLSGRH